MTKNNQPTKNKQQNTRILYADSKQQPTVHAQAQHPPDTLIKLQKQPREPTEGKKHTQDLPSIRTHARTHADTTAHKHYEHVLEKRKTYSGVPGVYSNTVREYSTRLMFKADSKRVLYARP